MTDLALQIAGQFARELQNAIGDYSLAMEGGTSSTFTCTVKFVEDPELGMFARIKCKSSPGIADHEIKLDMFKGQLDLFRSPPVEPEE
jgi:hypothetical protein